MNKILIYNSGGGLGDSIQLFPLIISLQNHFNKSKFFYLGAHKNHFNDKLKEYGIHLETLRLHNQFRLYLDQKGQSTSQCRCIQRNYR